MAFVFFNRYLDLAEAIDDPNSANIDNAEFDQTDIPSPYDIPLPEKNLLSDDQREEIREKKKWLVPLNFNSKSSNFIEPRKNLGESKIPIPISGEVRLKFKNLVDSKKFYHKIYKNK